MGICFSWSLLSIFLPCKPETTYKGTSYPQGWLVPLSTTGLEVTLTQKRPGISLSDRFFLFQGENACRPTQNSWQIHLARAIQHIPVTGKKGQPASFLLSIYGFHRTAPAVWEKRQKVQPASFLLSIHGFHRTAPAAWEKDKRDSLRCPSCLWGNHKI